MTEPLVFGAVAAGVVALLVIVIGVVRRLSGATDAQRDRDRAHRDAQKRPPEAAATKGETYELVVKETQYDRVPPEVRGTINGLQTFVKDVPDPNGADAVDAGETIRVRVTDYGAKGTTAEAQFLGRR
jgi:predicted RNA-binding protein with TRAM domain